MSQVDFLRRKITELETMQTQAGEDAVQIKEKMALADAKKASESGEQNYHKWSQILQTLEKELDRVKARLAKCNVELEEKRRRLQEEEAKAAEEEETAAVQEAEPEVETETADRIMSMSMEELAELSFEDIARLQEEELARTKAQETPSAAHKPAEEEPKPRKVQSPEELRKQRELQAALEKAVGPDPGSLQIKEVEPLLDLYIKRSQSAKSGDPVLQALGAAMEKVAQVCAKFHEKWDSRQG